MLSAIEAASLDGDLLDACLTRLASMLHDDCYAARRTAATSIPLLYSRWVEPKARAQQAFQHERQACLRSPQAGVAQVMAPELESASITERQDRCCVKLGH